MQLRRNLSIFSALTPARIVRVSLMLALILALVPGWGSGNVNAGCPAGFFYSAGKCWPCTGGPSDGPECPGGSTPADDSTTETEPNQPQWWVGNDPNGDYRVNHSPAEDFAVYCLPPGYVEVWRITPAPPILYAQFPIAWVYFGDIGLPSYSQTWDLTPFARTSSSLLSIRRRGDNVTISADSRQKTFSLSECAQKAGLTLLNLAQLTTIPCDQQALAAAEARVAELQKMEETARAALEDTRRELLDADRQAKLAEERYVDAQAAAQQARAETDRAVKSALDALTGIDPQGNAGDAFIGLYQVIQYAEEAFAQTEDTLKLGLHGATAGPLSRDDMISVLLLGSAENVLLFTQNTFSSLSPEEAKRIAAHSAELARELAQKAEAAAQQAQSNLQEVQLTAQNARANFDAARGEINLIFRQLNDAKGTLAKLKAACQGQNE